MAKKKFTQLPAAGVLSGDEIIAVVQDGASKQSTLDQVQTFISSSALRWGGFWSFPASAFPDTDSVEGVLFIASADHGLSGDPDYVQANTWFVSRGTGTSYADFSYNL